MPEEYSYYQELRRIRKDAYAEYLQQNLDDQVSQTFAKARNDRDIRDLQRLALESPAQFQQIMKMDMDLLAAENTGFQREMSRDRKRVNGEIMPNRENQYDQPQIESSDIINVSDFFNI